MKTLVVLLLLVRACCFANINADLMFDPNNAGPVGMLTTNGLSACLTGSNWLYAIYAGTNANNTFQRTFVQPSLVTNSYLIPVTVSNITYTTDSTNWIAMNFNTNLYEEDFYLCFGRSDASNHNSLICGFETYNFINTNLLTEYATDILQLDLGGGWCIDSHHMYATNNNTMLSHSQDCTSDSLFGTEIQYTPSKTYFRVMWSDVLDQTNYVKWYDPSNWSLVGQSQSYICPGPPWLMIFRVGYIYQMPGYVYHGRQYVKLNATLADFNALDSTNTNPGSWVLSIAGR